jgi:hypothetical protein
MHKEGKSFGKANHGETWFEETYECWYYADDEQKHP